MLEPRRVLFSSSAWTPTELTQCSSQGYPKHSHVCRLQKAAALRPASSQQPQDHSSERPVQS